MYGLLSAIAVNFFFQPGNIYSSGVTGLAQVVSAISNHFMGIALPVSLTFYALNLPLIVISWFYIGHKFATFTFITVTMSSFFIQIVPQVTLTPDPIMNAIFGGLAMGTGVGFALKNNVSSGGTDIVSLLVRQKTGKNVGSISLIVNLCIMSIAGVTFGWRFALYSMITIFISSQMTDVIFAKQKKMQAMIVTNHPKRITRLIQNRLHRGVTIINEAEGGYNHDQKAILITIISRVEFNDFKQIIRKADPHAFVSVSDNVKIIGRFVEEKEL
ncbi:Integral membrane protein [Streptococcus sp. DD13]|nr:Integral membrane protein [Streptococcus sp. DD13]